MNPGGSTGEAAMLHGPLPRRVLVRLRFLSGSLRVLQLVWSSFAARRGPEGSGILARVSRSLPSPSRVSHGQPVVGTAMVELPASRDVLRWAATGGTASPRPHAQSVPSAQNQRRWRFVQPLLAASAGDLRKELQSARQKHRRQDRRRYKSELMVRRVWIQEVVTRAGWEDAVRDAQVR